MDSIGNILGDKAQFTPPDEMSALKEYVEHHYGARASVRVDKQMIILTVPGSALAGTLQLQRNKIIKDCRLTKKLLIRIGS